MQKKQACANIPPMSMIVIEVEKNQNENSLNLLRRFTKKLHGSKILNIVRAERYTMRPSSKLRKKRRVLKSLATAEKMEHLKKLGKLKLPAKK